MTSTTETSSPSNQGDLFSLLDADNIKIVEETKALIHENLHSSRDPGLLHATVEYYLKTRSHACLQILSGIHEARAQALFEKMNECIKHRVSRLDTLTLLGHIVRKQPSWLYKVLKTPLFDTLLKCMKSDSDVVVLTSGILTITTLLPLVPASIGPWLHDLFDIFTRLSSFRAHRQGNAPEVYLLHLHVAVYLFFHRLYAMYPNNFMLYLRALNGEPSKQGLFQDTIKPMLEHVRLHPCVITETPQTETEKHRWKQKEPHDIVIECMKLSLDPFDRIQEKGTFMSSSMYRHSHHELFADKSIGSILTASYDSQGPEVLRSKERRMSDSATQTGKSLQSGDSGTESCSLPVICSDNIPAEWSPSEICQLSTPPSSRMSPSTSNPDLVSSLTIHPHCCTHAVMYTPGQSPTTSLGDDVAYNQGYSNSPSVSGSKGKSGTVGGTYSGRGTPVRGGKAASHDGQLSRALLAALAQHSHESAPASVGGHQTSTPKEPGKYEEDDKIESQKEGASCNGETSPRGSLITFEAHGKEAKGTVPRTACSLEKFDSTSVNILPKEEYRDLGEGDFALETDEYKTPGSQHDGITADLLPEPPTPGSAPAGDQAMDTITLVNSSGEFKSCTAIETNESQDARLQPCSDSNRLLQSGEIQDQRVSADLDKGHKSLEVSKSESSLASVETSLDSSKCHSITPGTQQTYHPSHTCDLLTAFPHLLHLIRGEHDQNSPISDGEEGSFSRNQNHVLSCTASPVEVLDNYLKTGSSLHYGELSRVPLVSQTGTVWTHFGGDPPADEVEILRGQVKLLHNQLLFERHKCDLHAIRNRRLIGKTFKAVQYQEELLATKDQLRLQEDKMRELTDALNKQMEESRRFKSITSSWESNQRIELRNLLNENAQLKSKETELMKKLETQQKDYDTKHTEIQQLKAKIFTLENEVDLLRVKASEKEQLSKQVNQLVKELLVMGELNQQQKDAIKKLTAVEGQNPESNMQLHGCQRELAAAKQTVKRQKDELEALTAKLADMETLVSNKEFEIREMKKFTEGLKGTYVGKIQSLEEKYSSQKKVTQALESYILNLQAVDGARRERIAVEKTEPES